MVYDILRNLNVNKSVGPDGIHPKFLKELSNELYRPLTMLFNNSLVCGELPKEWKQGKISAIYKKGSRKVAGNYRPVSLTSIVCKCLEICVRNHIVSHMTKNNLFSPQQFGFIRGRSTVLQLLNVMNLWTSALDRDETIDTIYLDFLKAFDTVPHRRLLGKIESFGITGHTLRWVQAFLTDRIQQVHVNGAHSEWANVTSGIPQGSVLGPILFVLYINDLPSNINSNVYMFADDTKIFNNIKSPEDQVILQKDLDILAKWSDKWLLRFHPNKCKVMHLGKPLDQQYVYTLNTNDIPYAIEYIVEEKDIGVVIDSKLEFENHIHQKISKASSIMEIIRRSFTTLNTTNFTSLYKALVRSNLEYASCIWFPYKQKHIEAIEKVQRRATKQLPGMKDLSYQERLKILKLPSLVYRRTRGDMIETYKLLHNTYDSEVSNIVKLHEDNTSREATRGHSLKLHIERPRKNIRKESFPLRITKIWNELPDNVVTASSVNCFKSRLDRHWLHEDFLYNYLAPVPGKHRAEDRARTNKDLTIEATACGQKQPK